MDDHVDEFTLPGFLEKIRAVLPAGSGFCIPVCLDVKSRKFKGVMHRARTEWGYSLTNDTFNQESSWKNLPAEGAVFLSRIRHNISALRNLFGKNCMVHLNARLRPIILEVVGELPH